MTNRDKYLKDGVSEYDFLTFVFNEGHIGWNGEEDYCYIKKLDLLHLLQQPVKPTLTEDERAILRNINPKEYENIGRAIGDHKLYLNYEIDKDDFAIDTMYGHLFQFIQPRRRI